MLMVTARLSVFIYDSGVVSTVITELEGRVSSNITFNLTLMLFFSLPSPFIIIYFFISHWDILNQLMPSLPIYCHLLRLLSDPLHNVSLSLIQVFKDI